MTPGTLYRLSAFTTSPDGGNPAGVWIGDQLPTPAEMQRIAADVGFSETAFVVPDAGLHRTVRYYSPAAEVAFCGHATIAAGVLLGELNGEADYQFDTRPGMVPVSVRSENGMPSAALTSVDPKQEPIDSERLRAYLLALGWDAAELDPAVPPVKAFGGAWHLVLAARSADRLDCLAYEFEQLRLLMLEDGLTTVQLIWRESPGVVHARNPFPVGNVVEDPATGAAAAALGGYLRDARLVEPPVRILIRQGEAMGRPSRLIVDIPENGGIRVSGHAVRLPDGR